MRRGGFLGFLKKWVWLSLLVVPAFALSACGGGGGGGSTPSNNNTSGATYSVIYSANGATGGSAPVDSAKYNQGTTVTVPGNTGSLVKTGYYFLGWNTMLDGSGTIYTAGTGTFTMGTANVTLYADWVTYAYVVNYRGGPGLMGDISQYAVNANGALSATPVSNATSAGNGPGFIAVDPFGKYAYVPDWNNEVYQYTIDQTTGNLSPMSPAYVAAGSNPISMALDPIDGFAYVANNGDGTITPYGISSSNGALQPLAWFKVIDSTLSVNPTSIVVTSGGSFLYVTDSNNNCPLVGSTTGYSCVWEYAIDNSNGTLNAISGSAVSAGSAFGADAIAADPKASYVYVANDQDNAIYAYSISSTGVLTQIDSKATDNGNTGYPDSIAIDPTGRYLYAANAYDGTVAEFTINQSNGTLTEISGSPVTCGSGVGVLTGIATDVYGVTVDQSGKYVYATNDTDNTVWQYTIGAGGALTPMSTSSVATEQNPESIATIP